jgi:hypothetical protein
VFNFTVSVLQANSKSVEPHSEIQLNSALCGFASLRETVNGIVARKPTHLSEAVACIVSSHKQTHPTGEVYKGEERLRD